MTETALSERQARLDFALAAADQAGEFVMSRYQKSDLVVDRKRDASPVTEADRGAEQLIRRLIAERYPDDAVLGEEFGDTPGSSGWRWILDPIDGTKSFIHGVPLFGTLIGLEQDDRPVVGVCRIPALNEVVYAARGLGAFWQTGDEAPRPARVSGVSTLEDATFCTTTINGWQRYGHQATFERLSGAFGLSRGWGDCYGHILVATGRADVMVDPHLSPWDCAALVPIMQETGGHLVDFRGEVTIHSTNGLSVNDALLHSALNLINGS